MTGAIIDTIVVPVIYLLSAVLFIYGLKRQARVRTARQGNALAAFAMLLAVVGALLEMGLVDYRWIIMGTLFGGLVGVLLATRVAMTAMPEMVALFNGSGGAASALVALAVFWVRIVQPGYAGTVASEMGDPEAVTLALSIIVGGVTLTGSVVAFLKLNGWLKKGAAILLPGRHVLNLLLAVAVIGCSVWFGFMTEDAELSMLGALGVTGGALLLGILLVIPIGGADMPVVVSLLNSYSGIAASMTGFVIGNPVLIIAGALVGAAGLILTQIMCVAMNRSLFNVLIGGFGETASAGSGGASDYENVTSCGPEEAAMVLESAESLIVIPGYGLAVAQAQHTMRELADLLKKRGTKVRYGIHPVAGRMPGHMNVLLAEADVPYDELIEMDEINSDFKNTDVVIVLGANDVVNPVALDDKTSPIYGMPILHAHEARSVFVIKRSLSPGYAGVKNPLFEYPNAMMVFGDAKKVLQGLVNEVKEL